MNRKNIFTILISLIIANAPQLFAGTKATIPAGDKDKFIAPLVKSPNKVFENPQVENGPWNTIIPKKVALMPQMIATPMQQQMSVAEVEVRVVHNGSWIAVAISWKDTTRSELTGTGLFSDAIAVGIPQKDPGQTSPFMGGPNMGMEINYWKALWQKDIDKGYQEVTELHPNTTADEYHGYRSEKLKNSDPASVAKMKEVMSTKAAKEALPAVAIGNPVSQLDRKYPVEQAVAEGFGTLSTQENQNARAHGTYKDGKWHVVITRPLATKDKADAPLSAGKTSALNFAVWDGHSGDKSGKKNYSMFTPLEIATK